MKEQFRTKNFHSTISIKYTDTLGRPAIWTANQLELIENILTITQSYVSQGYRLTSRQLYYQLVARDMIPNAIKVYTKICKIIVSLRYCGYMDWLSIEDRGRVPTIPSEWNNISELIESAISAYRLPRWSDQDYYLELYCEKQALENILLPIARKYHIYFGVNKGYSSASTMYTMAKRIEEKIDGGKSCVILYLGDHDPSGLDMVRDIHERTCEFLRRESDDDNDTYFDVRQIALSQAQIKQYKPPHNPAKFTDPRAKWYISKFGEKSWELDALEPEVLIKLTEYAILDYLDANKYNKWIKRERRESKKLKEFGKTL